MNWQKLKLVLNRLSYSIYGLLRLLNRHSTYLSMYIGLKMFAQGESVDCLVCSDEDLRRNILTDFASIIWLTVSIHIYSRVQNST